MKRRLPIARFPSAILFCTILLLSGCGVGKSVEERINSAFPVGADILKARERLDAFVKAQALDAKPIEDDYNAHLSQRALECAHGYAPSAFASDAHIREVLAATDCFAKADRKLQEWLGRRHIGLVLAARPLRPIPVIPPTTIVATDSIQDASFAERAGIVLVQSPGKYQAIDIGSGQTIGRGTTDGSPATSLSPNGRLFVDNKGRDAEVRETESGIVLATFPQVQGSEFHWVNDVGAIFTPAWTPEAEGGRSKEGPVFLDFASGRESPIAITTGAVRRVVALPGAGPRLAVLASDKIGVVQVKNGARGWEASLIYQRVLPSSGSWSRNTSGLTADGGTFFGTGQTLQLVTLPSMDMHFIMLDPLRLQSVVATADPDRLLLAGFFTSSPGSGTEYALYSMGQRTLAKVNQQLLASTRIIYIPSLRSNGVIDGARITLLDSIPTAPALPMNEYLEVREQAVAALASGARLQAVQPIANPSSPASAAPAAVPAKTPIKNNN